MIIVTLPPSQVGVHITSASADYLVIDSKGDSPLHNILGLKANLVNGSPFDWTESNPSIDTINMYSLDGTTTPLTPVGSGSGSGAPTIILSPPVEVAQVQVDSHQVCQVVLFLLVVLQISLHGVVYLVSQLL